MLKKPDGIIPPVEKPRNPVRSMRRGCLLAILLLLDSRVAFAGFQKRVIAVEDAIETQRPVEGELKLSPDGTQVAYITKTANLATNENEYRLYVRDLGAATERSNGKVLLISSEIGGLQWLSGGLLTVRFVPDGTGEKDRKPAVGMIRVGNGELETLNFGKPVSAYSMGRNGNTVVFASPLEPAAEAEAERKQKELVRSLYGYRIGYRQGLLGDEDSGVRSFQLFLATKAEKGNWNIRKLQFSGPQSLPLRDSLDFVEQLKLSPDGRYVLVRFRLEQLPLIWREQPFVREVQELGGTACYYVLCLYEIATGRLRLDFNYPGLLLDASWAADSTAYSVIGPSPFGSAGNRTEAQAAVSFGIVHTYMFRFAHVFTVDADTGRIQIVARRDSQVPGYPKYMHDVPLFWDSETGRMLVRLDERAFGLMVYRNGAWTKDGTVESAPAADELETSFDSDGRNFVYMSEAPTRPPDLVLRDLKQKMRLVLTDLNPKFKNIVLGDIEPFEWVNEYGSHCSGRLIKPPGFRKGKKYPFIFIAAGYGKRFVSDIPAGTLGAPGFVPQSLASAGFIVLLGHYPDDNHIPQGRFPGRMREAWNWKAMVESAIAALSRKGLADASNVGLAGFSRTSWLCDFTVTHSVFPFVAASSSDGGAYTYRGYFKYNSGINMDTDESQVGGPPLGKTLRNWLVSAPAFNAVHVRPALLMEYTGDIGDALEFFIALNRMGKAVELYHYPKGTHPLNTPLERLASTQRNLDWFRFWMQGYTGSDPEYDPGQFERWRKMKVRRNSSGKSIRRIPVD